MPAKSKAQQRFMGMVHAVQKGELSPSKVSDKVKDVADDMSDSDAEDFASTKHGGKPEKVAKEVIRKIREILKPIVKESYASMFGEFTKDMKSSSEVQAAKELADEYDIGKVLYIFRTNPRAFKQAVKEKMKEMKTFNKAKKLKEGGMGILSSDQADVLQGIVMRNKSKNLKALLSIVIKNKMFKGVDKKELLGYIDGARQFVKYMKSHPMESVNEANASVIRKKLLKQFGDDPLYKDFIIAKTPKEQKKALKTLKSIRGFNAVRLMQKYVKKLQDESVNEAKMTHVLTKDIGKKKMKDLVQFIFNVLDLAPNKDFRLSSNGKILSVNVDKINRKSIQNIKKRYGVDLKESINESAVSFWQDMFRPGPIPKEYINQLIKKKGELPSKKHIKKIYRSNGNPSSSELAKTWKQLTKEKYVRAASGMWRWNADFTGWESVTEGVKAQKAYKNIQKARTEFLERWGKLKKQLNTLKTESPNNEIFRLEKKLYEFETEFIDKSSKLMSSISKIAKSNLTEGKINEIDYGNIFADMGDKLSDFKMKVVKPGMRLYNKGKAKFYMRDLYKSLEKCVDLCDMMNLMANESVSVNEEIAKGKGVQKIFDIQKNGYGKLGGRMLDSLSAGLFTQLYDRAPDNIKEKMNKMNEKRLYIVIGKMWNKFGKNVRLSS